MKRKLLLAALSVASALGVNAQEILPPYFSEAKTSSTLIGSETVADLENFTTSQENWTYEMSVAVATEVKVPYNSYQYATYTPSATTTLRLVKANGTVYAYEKEGETYVYKGEASITSCEYPVMDETTVSTNNILGNGDFAEKGDQIQSGRYKLGTPWQFYSDNYGSIRIGENNAAHDGWVFVFRADSEPKNGYFYQEVELKPNAYYKAVMSVVANSNGTGPMSMCLGSTPSGFDYSYKSFTTGVNTYAFELTTPSELGAKSYFSVCNRGIVNSTGSNSNHLNQIDYIILCEANEAKGITGGSDVKYLATDVVPEVESTNGYDYTYIIKNPTFNGTSDGWVNGSDANGGGGDYRLNTVQGKTCWNSWDDNFISMDIHQDITGLPDGIYKVRCKAITQDGRLKDQHAYAKSSTGTVVSPNMTIANFTSPEGWETLTTADATVMNDGTLTIGFASTSGGAQTGWFCVTDFELVYVRALTDEDYKPAALAILSSSLDAAKALNTTENIGDGVFQIPESAVTALTDAIATAQGVYDAAESTLAEVENATEALNSAIEAYKNVELNAPAEGTRYYLKPSTIGHEKFGNAVLATLGATSDNNPTGYSFGASASPKDYLAQAFIFTQVEGNNYNISIETTEGIVYLTYGSLNGSAAGWKAQQIQGTTNPDNKGTFKIEVSNVKNSIKIFNTENNNYIDCQAGGALYTDTGVKFEDFEAVEAEKATVSGSLDAGKYATRIFPFIPELPAGVKAYTFGGVEEGNVITLNTVDSPTANVPYILENTSPNEEDITLSGYGLAKQDVYTANGLTGTYEGSTTVPAGSYVLQTLDNGQKFYLVGEETAIEMPAYRAYLTIENAAGVKAFSFGGETTGINGVETLTDGAVESIYTINGTRVNSLQKGLNIVKMSNGKTQKVLVK